MFIYSLSVLHQFNVICLHDVNSRCTEPPCMLIKVLDNKTLNKRCDAPFGFITIAGQKTSTRLQRVELDNFCWELRWSCSEFPMYSAKASISRGGRNSDGLGPCWRYSWTSGTYSYQGTCQDSILLCIITFFYQTRPDYHQSVHSVLQQSSCSYKQHGRWGGAYCRWSPEGLYVLKGHKKTTWQQYGCGVEAELEF